MKIEDVDFNELIRRLCVTVNDSVYYYDSERPIIEYLMEKDDSMIDQKLVNEIKMVLLSLGYNYVFNLY